MKRSPFTSSGKEILGLSKVTNTENTKDGDLGDVEDAIITNLSKGSSDYKQDFERELAKISTNIGIDLGISNSSLSSKPPTKSFDLTRPKAVPFVVPKKTKPVKSESESESESSVSESSVSESSSSSHTTSSVSSRKPKHKSPPPSRDYIRRERYNERNESSEDRGSTDESIRPSKPDSSDRRRREQLRSFLNEGYRNFNIGDHRQDVEQLDVLEMASEIDQIRYNLIDISVEKSSLPAVDLEKMSHSEIQRLLFFYRRMDDQYKYKSLPEELILGAAGFAEQIFDGQTEILGKWKPDYTGLQNNMQSRLTRVSPYMGRVVADISRKNGISEISLVGVSLCLPLISLPFSNARKISKPTRNQLTMSALNDVENA
jgi:hypothetical protein